MATGRARRAIAPLDGLHGEAVLFQVLHSPHRQRAFCRTHRLLDLDKEIG